MDAVVGLPWMVPPPGSRLIERRGRAFLIDEQPRALAAARAFAGGSEDATLQFFDAALPGCSRMIDFGASLGFTALYASTTVPNVYAFEPNPDTFALMQENVARNIELVPRIRLYRHGVAERDDDASGAAVTLRNADTVLREIGLDRSTLLKIDIAGAEYLVLPAIANLLAERRPYLHVSFHPSNIVLGADEYRNTIARMRRAMQVAEAVACYRYMHLFSNENWFCVAAADRMDFLRQYLLRPKQMRHVTTEEYGFIDAVGFSDTFLPQLRG